MQKLGCWKTTLLAAIMAMPLVAGCGKTIGETIDDTTITTRVKTSMLNDPAVGGTSSEKGLAYSGGAATSVMMLATPHAPVSSTVSSQPARSKGSR